MKFNKILFTPIIASVFVSCNNHWYDPEVNPHINYVPGGQFRKEIRNTVENLHDSTLEARVNTYNMLLEDYKKSTWTTPLQFEANEEKFYSESERSCLKNNKKGWYTRFNNVYSDYNVYPIFADEIGIKTVHDYDKYLKTYEQDSINARYAELYKQYQMEQNAIVRDSIRKAAKTK